MSKFQSRHYKAIAEVVAEHVGVERYVECNEAIDVLDELIKDLARLFEADNPNFDAEKFIAACKS